MPDRAVPRGWGRKAVTSISRRIYSGAIRQATDLFLRWIQRAISEPCREELFTLTVGHVAASTLAERFVKLGYGRYLAHIKALWSWIRTQTSVAC
jgi:hypothetical protein